MARLAEQTLLMPPGFDAGLDRWSPQEGDPAGPSLEAQPGAILVLGDEALGDCLELTLAAPRMQVRWMGETPLLPGAILQLRLRGLVIAGPAPLLRIAGSPLGRGGRPLAAAVACAAPAYPLAVGEIRAAAATAGPLPPRPGLDLAFGECALVAHFGFDIEGEPGTVVRLDRLRITRAR